MPLLAARIPGGARRTVVAVLLACALVAVALPTRARADGDPASDVLLFQTYFLPPDAGASVAVQERLVNVVGAARRAGYGVRVAVIASPADLGSIAELWRQPGNYVRFLSQEIALVSSDRVLVVMPNGLGLYSPGGTTAAERAVIASPAPGGPGGLAGKAIGAIERLASADGHPLPHSVASATSAPSTTASGDSTSTASVVAFIVGLILIVAAWTASLRSRPLARRATTDRP
jgi:hypothetical protein